DTVIEIEVQNETNQSQERLRFAVVPRIGEGLRLLGPDGMWASFDVIDVWYQKADFGDLWVPFLHVCMTPGEASDGNVSLADPFEVEDPFEVRSVPRELGQFGT